MKVSIAMNLWAAAALADWSHGDITSIIVTPAVLPAREHDTELWQTVFTKFLSRRVDLEANLED